MATHVDTMGVVGITLDAVQRLDTDHVAYIRRMRVRTQDGDVQFVMYSENPDALEVKEGSVFE